MRGDHQVSLHLLLLPSAFPCLVPSRLKTACSVYDYLKGDSSYKPKKEDIKKEDSDDEESSSKGRKRRRPILKRKCLPT